jgi:predicted ATPase
LSNKAVARELNVSIKTVEFHLSNVYRKLGIASRVELANQVTARRARSAALSSGNLGSRRSSLLGRDRQLAELDRLLETASLVTLVGVGGVGKTVLATAVGHRVAERFADGVWLVDLRMLAAGGDVLNACFMALSLRPLASLLTARDIAVGLGDQQRLVIIDNCEHVLDDAARVAEAIAGLCPRAVVLATSRERFDVAGEHAVPVPAMPTCDDGGVSLAVELFVERAREALGEFEPSASELLVVGEICRRLDGLPLAIELAAARVVGLSVDDIHHRLDDRFGLLTRRRPSERQHSLRATIEWSYDLLSDAERWVLESLSVFVGDFDLAAATTAGEDPGDPSGPRASSGLTADRVLSLVDKSMLVAVRNDVGVRYQMLETIREFAADRLTERGDREQVRRRLLGHYARFLHVANIAVRGVDEVAGHLAIQRDWHNLRTAIGVACDFDDGPVACALINDVLWWAFSRERVEAGDWADRVRHLPSVVRDPARVATTMCSANFAWIRGQFDVSAELIELARDEEDKLGEHPEPWPSFVTATLASQRMWTKDGWLPFPDAAVPLAAETTERAQRHEDEFWIAQGKIQQADAIAARLASDPGNIDVADWLPPVEEALALAQHRNHPESIARATASLGRALVYADPTRSQALLERSIALSDGLGLELYAGFARVYLITVHLLGRRWVDAVNVGAQAIRSHLRIGALGELQMDVAPLPHALARLGHPQLALTIAEAIRSAYPSSFELWDLERTVRAAHSRGVEPLSGIADGMAGVIDLTRHILELADNLNEP